MPAYDTPPPPPVHLLRERPRRAGPLFLGLGGGFLILLGGLFFVRTYKMEKEAQPLRERSMFKAGHLAKAALLYAEDHEKFPGGFSWNKQLAPYGIKGVDLQTPLGSWSRYSMRRNSERQSKAALRDPGTYLLFLDGFGNGGGSMFPVDLEMAWQVTPYRRKGVPGNVFSFADGHAAFVPQRDWDPEITEKGPVR